MAHTTLVMSQKMGAVSLMKISVNSHITMRVTQNTQAQFARVKCERFHRNLGVISYITVDVTSQLIIRLLYFTTGEISHSLRDETEHPSIITLIVFDVPKWGSCNTEPLE